MLYAGGIFKKHEYSLPFGNKKGRDISEPAFLCNEDEKRFL